MTTNKYVSLPGQRFWPWASQVGSRVSVSHPVFLPGFEFQPTPEAFAEQWCSMHNARHAAHDADCSLFFCSYSLQHFNNIAILVIHVWSVGDAAN